jgi:biotin transporter BioY
MKKSVSNLMLILIVIMVTIYTIATFALQYFTAVEISPTLTTAWFAFWGAEVVSLAAIKTSKVKHKYKHEEEEKECDIEEIEEMVDVEDDFEIE